MKNKIIRILFAGLVFVLSGCVARRQDLQHKTPMFYNEQKVVISGYKGNAMEPFISKDGKYLFFNNLKGKTGKDIFYAERVNDTLFEFKGEVKGVNTKFEEATPSMDKYGNFYFISTRDIAKGTVFCGVFCNGRVCNVHHVGGNINVSEPYWINMGASVFYDGNYLILSNAEFPGGVNFPERGNLKIAIRKGNNFEIARSSSAVLENINTNYGIEYAGELSTDKTELFYSQVVLSNPPVFHLYYVERKSPEGVFGRPSPIQAPFEHDKFAVVEAPTLSGDGKKLYYHKLGKDGVYSIYVIFRRGK